MLQRLPIALAKERSSNAPKKLQTEIRQIKYFFVSSNNNNNNNNNNNKTTKTV